MPRQGETSVNINRRILTTSQLNENAGYEKSKFSCKLKKFNAWDCLISLIPILDWLPSYSVKQNLIGDLLAGLTLTIIMVPQSLAYGILCHMGAINGIYTSFFPVIGYIIFTSSRHNSVGTFAVTAIMTKTAILGVLKDNDPANKEIDYDTQKLTPIEIGSALTMTVSLMLFIMFILRMGIITVLLSRAVVSGFTTGAAVHTFTAQIASIFGIKIKSHAGLFYLSLTYYEILKNIYKINWVTFTIGVLGVVILSVDFFFLKPRWNKFTKIPLPMELIVLVVGIMVTYYGDLNAKYGVWIVGTIPAGFPVPIFPPLSIMKKLIGNAVALTAVTYCLSMSIGLTYAKEKFTPIDSNQELLAFGVANFFGSIFQCYPCCSSLARSALAAKMGGLTQVTSIFTAVMALLIILWIGPLFKHLPICLLGSVILVSLFRLFAQAKELPVFWKLSKFDACLWVITFSSVVILDVDYGLFIGAGCSFILMCWINFLPQGKVLGLYQGTEIFLDKKEYNVSEIDGLKIVQLAGSINYGTSRCFYDSLSRTLDFDVKKYLADKKRKKIKCGQKKKEKEDDFTPREEFEIPYQCLIIDMAMIKYLDPSGVEFIEEMIYIFEEVKIKLLISGMIGSNFAMIETYKNIRKKQTEFLVFPTLLDAFMYYKANIA